MPMQINVMAHAVYGHVALCKMNFLFPETGPDTALNRFALYREKVLKLIRDPRWGWEGVEYITDAAGALSMHTVDICLPFPVSSLTMSCVSSSRERQTYCVSVSLSRGSSLLLKRRC